MVARSDVRDVFAYGLDDSCALVSHDRRPATRAEVSVGVADVGVTDARRRDAYQDLVRLGRVELDLFDRDRTTRRVENRRAYPHQTIR